MGKKLKRGREVSIGASLFYCFKWLTAWKVLRMKMSFGTFLKRKKYTYPIALD